MSVSEVSVFFDTQVRMPNGLQWFENELFVMDQLTDDVFVLDEQGKIKRVISTETENGSGITYGGGFLWTACNGTACLLYTSPSPRDGLLSRMPSSA